MPNNSDTVFNTQINLLYQQQPAITAAIFFASSMLGFILWDEADNHLIIAWLACIYTFAALLVIQILIHRYKKHIMSTKAWATSNVISNFISGCIWGGVPLLFLDFSAPAYTSIIIMVIIGTSIGNVASASAYPSSHAAYAIPCMMLTVLALLLDPAQGSNYLAILCFGFLIVNLGSSRNLYRTTIDSIILRIEHVDLLGQLTKEKEVAEKANLSKSRFLAAASHDLRQPVHALSIFTDALRNIQNTPNNVKNLSEKISRCVNGLDKLFDSLLDISKLDAGTVDIDNEHYDIKTQCEDLIASLKPQADQRNIDLNLITSPEVEHFIVNSDKVLSERILSNLLNNALNYTDKGHITVKLEKTVSHITVSIIDTGKGIAEENLNKIFDEYYQLHNPERDRNKGLGLGLSICKRLATLLNTSITVTSTTNQGSCFSFSLEVGSADNVQAFNITNTSVVETFLQDKCIIVIDDEEDIREAMHTLLSQWHCQRIYCVADQFEACHLITEECIPDIIISDYRLQNNHNGIEAIEAIHKAASRQIPALLISGDTGPDIMHRIKDSGFMLLHKPVAPAKLKIAVKTLLER